MKPFIYKFLLIFSRGLIALKRAMFFLGTRAGQGGKIFGVMYRKTIGYGLYILSYRLKRLQARLYRSQQHKYVQLLTKRTTLQLVLFCFGLIVMFPHSQFAQRASAATVYGRNTPLYAFIGPSDEFDVPIEVVVEGLPDQELSSLEGMSSTTPIITDLSGTSAGGTAIIKPIQRPGAVLPPVQTSSSSESGTVIASDRRDVIEYVVQSGDVIGSIAEAHGVSVQTILTENDLTARSYIRPGQVLSILPVSGVTHTVRSGDTVIKIANTYDAEADDVIAFNRLKNDGSDIVVGETLVIPGGTKQAAPTYVASNPTPVVSNPIKQVVAPPPSVQTPAGSGYIWPTSATIVTQYYGWRHTGIDIAGPAGSALYAARSGEVIKSQCGWNGGYGCHIIIDHGGGVQTLYAHALTDGLLVGVGEQVTQGDTIALMGSTGRSTGPHIHFEVRVNGQRVNPYQYIR